MTKPRLRKTGPFWRCRFHGFGEIPLPTGWGVTPQDAYRNWERILREANRLPKMGMLYGTGPSPIYHINQGRVTHVT